MAILQVRNMDDELYETLGRRAAMENRSISQEVIAIIQSHLSAPHYFKEVDEAVLNLAGTWEDKRSAEEIVTDIRDRRATRRFRETF